MTNTRKYLERAARSASLMLGEIVSMSDGEIEACVSEKEAFELSCQLGAIVEKIRQ